MTKEKKPYVITPARLAGFARRRKGNTVRVEGDIAYIKLSTTRGEYEAIIDADDLERVRAVGTWSLTGPANYLYVAHASRKNGNYLHRFITNAPKGDRRLCVDHLNGNTLDNRKANLRVTTIIENTRNSWYNRIQACQCCSLCRDHSNLRITATQDLIEGASPLAAVKASTRIPKGASCGASLTPLPPASPAGKGSDDT